jgi:hypothetical protein
MQRREAMKLGAFTLLATATGSMVGCDKKTIISWAGTAVSFLEQTLPYFQDLVPGSVAVLAKAITVAKQLQEALKAGSTNAIDFIQQLIAPDGLFQKILDDVGLITDEQKRKIVSGILAIAGVALTIIATALEQGSGEVPPEVVSKARSQSKSGVATIEKVSKGKTLEKALAALKN